ncbi:hypothetical protein E1176_09910 [Fulvivirga sp. RKSG066]|uniref:CHASE3 domain-containing protein n=1 Tax=Fulvivirga aurantia TaxID=2529383 RepID=UPI0012BB7DA6|nr:CHASE3 domain-containing protein [Fulvivirga aurantia]MTI21333.1 hypothetical protein [Fulvivirga aurantia]
MTSLRSFSIFIAVTIAFLLILSVVTYRSLNSYINDARWVNHASMVLKELEAVISSVKDAQTAHRGYELTADSTFLQPYVNSKNTVVRKVNTIDSLLLGNLGQKKRLDSLARLIEKQYNITDEILDRKTQGEALDSYSVNLLRFDEENMVKIRKQADLMIKAEEELLRERSSSQRTTGSIAPLFILISFIGAFLVLLYLFSQLYKTIKIKNDAEYELEQNLKLLSHEVSHKEHTQELLKRVLDSSLSAIYFIKAVRDTQGKIVDFRYSMANKQVEIMLKKDLSEMMSKTLGTAFPGVYESGLFDKYVAVVENDELLVTEFHYGYEHLDGWYSLTAMKLDDGCVVTFSDITERKMAEREMIHKNQELKESNENLEQFAYVASHDLQEPLRKVRTFGDRIATKYSDLIDAKGKDYINRMNNAAQRMQFLIDDLLKYSRVARHPKEMVKIDLEMIVNNLLGDLETRIKDRNATVNVKGLHPIQGDSTQLRQLFQNLISNAIKFTPLERNPVINITGKRVRGKSQKDFDIDSNKRYLRIELTDNGIGFEQKYAERIFNIFERLHGKSEFEGTGIGLAICQKVVQNHNGFIRAEGRENGGAKFIILLPVKFK